MHALLGATSVAPIILAVICTAAAGYIAKLVPPRQMKWMAAVQNRVRIVSESRVAPTLLMPVVTFTVYAIAQQVSGGNQFGVAQAFTSLSLISVLMFPVMNIGTAWPSITSAVACLDRI
ncbi:hypothetical protein B0T25DRAFT_570325 [Lasiosphaeria hispida]|uniref:Uncharacterized protein n=1 Tax=Lasiosphaeria hispida TaxID=260671 RepID=A0AAJ0MCP2_9PEZI|nr:hypothetical protein B0T25DRAFT_570325 [Lasiosphaeria hispida]